MRIESVVRCSAETMRLVNLQPKFLIIERSNASRIETDTFEQAQGVLFLCPKCFVRSGAAAHSVVCWFDGRAVPDGEIPEGKRWNVDGSGYGDLTLVEHIVLAGGCRWAGKIRRGVIRYL